MSRAARIHASVLAVAALGAAAAPTVAELSPEWLAVLPAGAALTAGLQRMVVAGDCTVKRDAVTGAQRWRHSYGANCVGCYDVPTDVIADTAGHVFVVGRSSSAPYSGDMILFVLDAGTGLETNRAVVSGGTNETVSGNILRLDAAEDLYAGGQYYNVNTGANDIAVFKYAALAGLIGDLNCEGIVNLGDINPFVLALSDPAAYAATYPDCQITNGDCNGDGLVDFDDINAFVALLAGAQ